MGTRKGGGVVVVHTCKFGFPFLRVIFMALHQLCCVSDVRTDGSLPPNSHGKNKSELVELHCW